MQLQRPCAWEKARVIYEERRCLFCSETRLKSYGGTCSGTRVTELRHGTRMQYHAIVRALKIYYAWRGQHPEVYDAAMDRLSRWLGPGRKNEFVQEINDEDRQSDWFKKKWATTVLSGQGLVPSATTEEKET